MAKSKQTKQQAKEINKDNSMIKVEQGNTEVLKVRFLSEISHHLGRIAKALEEK